MSNWKEGKHHDRAWLYYRYWIDELSTNKMAVMANVDPVTIRTQMAMMGISTRTLSEVHMGEHSGMWKGGECRSTYHYRARRAWGDFWGEPAPTGQDIHHVDGDRTNNEITNLTCMEHGAHRTMHNRRKYESN